MSISTSKRALRRSDHACPIGAPSLARAGINDYEFQLVDKEIKQGDAILSVRLVHKPDGKAVPDAVIFATRLDMAPTAWPKCRRALRRRPVWSRAFIASRSC